MKKHKEENTFVINHSSTLQDSINLAVAKYKGREFRAISGWNNVFDYCDVVPLDFLTKMKFLHIMKCDFYIRENWDEL